MAAGNNRERSKRKRLRTTSPRSPLFFFLFFFPSVSRMTLIDGLMGYPCINEFPPPRFSFKEASILLFFQYDFSSLFLEILVLEKY